MSDDIFRVGMTSLNGDKVQLYTPYNSGHSLTRRQARCLGEALIHMANLADEIDRTPLRDYHTGRFTK